MKARTAVIIFVAGSGSGFALAMMLVGSSRWGDYWICVANYATCMAVRIQLTRDLEEQEDVEVFLVDLVDHDDGWSSLIWMERDGDMARPVALVDSPGSD